MKNKSLLSLQAELWKKFNEEQIPSFMERFEKVLSASKSGYFVGDKVSLCEYL